MTIAAGTKLGRYEIRSKMAVRIGEARIVGNPDGNKGKMKRSALLAIALLQFSVSAMAQQIGVSQQPKPSPSAQQPATTQQLPPASNEDVVRITTNLVQVDAIVTDKDGKPVTDLKPEEIQIFEDGKRQKITHLSFFTGPRETTPPPKIVGTDKSAPAPSTTRLKREDVRRTIAIVVDDIGLSFESTYYVRRALKKFVDEQMQPGDLVALIRTAAGIGALQSFTSDPRQLSAAIEHIKWRPSFSGGVRAFTAIERDPMAEAATDADLTAPPADESAQFRADVFAVGTLGVLRYVIDGLHELPGRKSILLISDGLQITEGGTMLDSLRRLVDRASRASVAIYTMNASGLQTLHLTSADDANGMPPSFFDNPPIAFEQQMASRRQTYFNKQQGLDYLAQETGGLAMRNNNDLSGGIRRILQDQQSYYLIGYRPDESTFDPKTGRRTFHKLTLKVLRSGNFNVRMRNGFYGFTDQQANPTSRTAQQQMFAALASPFGSENVHVRLTSLFANDAKLGSYMRSLLHLDARDLTFTDEPDGSHKASIDLLAMTFGADGNPVEQISGPATLHVPGPLYQRVLRDGLLYFLTVPIKRPGVYQLRVALRDQSSERVGSASQFVDVPDFKNNRLALSGIILKGTDQPAARSSTSANVPPTSNQSNGADSGETVEPGNSAAVRQFQTGQVLQYAYAVYNARLDKVSQKPQVQIRMRLFLNGQPLSAPTAQPVNLDQQQDLKRLNVAGGIRLSANLAPGEYLLQVIATDPLADEKHRVATQWIDFQIVK